VLGAVAITLVAVAVVVVVGIVIREDERQEALEPFYVPPEPVEGDEPGELIRLEPLPDGTVGGGDGWRVLYWSERGDGGLVAASGMVFLPDGPAPPGGREILAWAHGTVGLGARCAPSRTDDVTSGFTWVDQALARGWAVTATDYAGLGTPGTEPYLIGEAEARDVVNSVRAARALVRGERPDEPVGARFAVYGHSQGGHSALWTGDRAATDAPELELVAVAAVAPAAELVPLVSEQYADAVAWFIGPDVAAAWPQVYPDLSLDGVLTEAGRENAERIAHECIEDAALEGLVRRDLFGQRFFAVDPVTEDAWREAAGEQSAPVLDADLPLWVGESTADEIVLPGTTALYIQRSCEAGLAVQTAWVDETDGMGHAGLGNLLGPTVVGWVDQRFQGEAPPSSCSARPPVRPAVPPAG
jgi:alpha-beta hydrolase superfamily lysophospholipase